MKDSIRTIVFATLLGLVCSLVLVGASQFTAPYRSANEEAERLHNFLGALEVEFDQEAGSKELLAIFKRDVQVKQRGALEFYEYVPEAADGSPVTVAVPFSGPGLWAPVHGVLALEPDLRTIRGVRFYKHEETPGLGGEISTTWFQERFRGKEIVSESGAPGFRILKAGSQVDKNSVDGIAGATLTCERVATMLNDLAVEISNEREKHDR